MIQIVRVIRVRTVVGVRLGAVVGAVALFAAGCGSPRATVASRIPLAKGESTVFPNSLSSDAAPTGTAVPFAGGAVAGAQPVSRELVTIIGLVRPHPMSGSSGHRFAGVELAIQNVGPTPYVDVPGRDVSLVSSTTGGYVGRLTRPPMRVGRCRQDLSKPMQLPPGRRVEGCVFFLLPRGQHVTAVQYQTQGGYGPNIATWALNRWQIHG